jgi:ATP-dependent Clp endopeptidase proteolytic subunit ClpP|tara:strand:+ start:155 stop:1315 length:1161 start_codon:yes stop_codon:yes gene_type:complete
MRVVQRHDPLENWFSGRLDQSRVEFRLRNVTQSDKQTLRPRGSSVRVARGRTVAPFETAMNSLLGMSRACAPTAGCVSRGRVARRMPASFGKHRAFHAGTGLRVARKMGARSTARAAHAGDLWIPADGPVDTNPFSAHAMEVMGSFSPGSAAVPGGGYSEHKPKTPPPDLPSLLLDSRIVYIGMPLVPAVTELIVSELLYMQYTDPKKACYIYINSTGCQRADGEVVGFETEATSIYDTMKYIGNDIFTVGTGVAYGQAAMILSAGNKGKRYMTSHATAMLHQPRVPSTGQRQAIEVHIKWKEVLQQKRAFVDILAKNTGHSIEKIDKDIQRPLYMDAKAAIAYGLVDKIIDKDSQAIDQVLSTDGWDNQAGLVKQERRAPPGGAR